MSELISLKRDWVPVLFGIIVGIIGRINLSFFFGTIFGLIIGLLIFWLGD